MNRKQLAILIFAVAVLGIAGLMLRKGDQQSWRGAEGVAGQKLIKDFPLNDVEQIAIKQATNQLTLAKKGDVWTLTERGGYNANFQNISDFLRKVWELKVVQPVEVGASQLGRLELLAPDKGAGSGTFVEFKDKSGKTINSLLLGKKHSRDAGGSSPFGGGGYPDGRYVMLGSDVKTVGVVSEAFANIEPKADEWLSKDFFKIEKLKAISVTHTNATNSWKLTRETETGAWKLADTKPGEEADAGKTSGMNNTLSSPTFTDVAVGAALDQPVAATLETFDNFTYTVKLAPKSGEDYLFQFAVAGNFPRERAAGKDEKPEDKTRLDKEFADKLKTQVEKLKNEQAFEKWVFVVSKWTVDPLFKERKDLLAEKKEEKKPEAVSPLLDSKLPVVPPPAK